MSTFKFKYFSVKQADFAHPIGTDAMVLGAAVEQNKPIHILDVGTGTGVLALMMAQRFPHSEITGLEKNEKASLLAEENFQMSPFADRLNTICSSFQEFTDFQCTTFDLIVSNPPFFKDSTLAAGNERSMARHQTSLPLEDLVRGVENLLSENGSFWVILPPDQSGKLLEFTEELQLNVHIKVYGKPGKHVRDIFNLSRRKEVTIAKDKLEIRDEEGNYSIQYKAMTRDFHGVAL